MHRTALCSALIATFFAHAAWAQVQEPVHRIYEEYRDTVPVSSPHVMVGLRTASVSGRADPRRITVFVPPRGADSLCIDLVSEDGKYVANFSRARSRHVGKEIITVPSTLTERLREYGPTRLAPLVHVSRNCSGDRELIIPAGWGDDASPRQLRMFLNPESVRWVDIDIGDAGDPIRCTRLDDPVQIAYEYACDLNGSTLTGFRTVTIRQRTLLPPRADPIPLHIWVPDGS